MLSLKRSDGTAIITKSLLFSAISIRLVTVRDSGNVEFGRNRLLRRSVASVSASDSVRANIVTGTLLWASNIPRVVPQVVVPIMAARVLNQKPSQLAQIHFIFRCI